MKKVIVLVMLLAIVLQTAAFAQAEFMYGEASVAEKVKIDSEEFKLHARIYNINGVPYVYNKFDVATNPVPYDENLKAIIGKEYIITDDYYLAFDVEKTGAISAGAYVPYTTLLIYDKQMNLIHEEDFGGGVSIEKVGYCGGVIYCEYAEKLVEVSENGKYYYERSYDPYIDRNSMREKINFVTVKSADMINWEVCDSDEIPISNSHASIFNNRVSIYEREPMPVVYESEHNFSSNIEKLGDWFVVYELDDRDLYMDKLYLSNDNIYFVPIELPDEVSNTHVRRFSSAYEVDNNIIISFDPDYLKVPTKDIYSEITQIEEAPYVLLNDKILGFSQPPVMESDRILVPMRFLFEQMGANVDWNNDTQSAIATISEAGQERKVEFSIDNTTALVNGQPETTDVPARLINDQTFVPLRFLSENLGYNVEWDDGARTAVITTK